MSEELRTFGYEEQGARYVLRPGGYAVVVGKGGRVAVVETPVGAHLPGGGQDPGEAAERAAVRECAEEAGLVVRITGRIGTADELVVARSERGHFRKRCTFFAARVEGETTSAEPDHVLVWRLPSEAQNSLHLGSERWAVGEARRLGLGLASVRRVDRLPSDLDQLVEASLVQGFGAIRRLRDDWRAGANRFDGEGEALFEARLAGELVGVCGLNRDPFARDPACGRVRRLFVLPSARRRGVARALVEAIVGQATPTFRRLHVRTDARAADRLYRALGFHRVEEAEHHTHALDSLQAR